MEQNEKKQQCRDQFNFIPFSLTPIFVHFQIPNFNSSLFQPITVLQSPEERIQSDVEKSVEGIEYFIRIFSPKQTAKSIQRRNQNMQMLCFEDSGDEEPDDVYNRRKKKASELMSREQQQVRIMLNIRSNSQEKYNAIIQFVKFLYDQKQSLTDVRTDYYSSKTFYALKNATIQQLRDLTKVMKKMLNNINKYQKKTVQSFQLLSSHLNKDSKIIQFLIIPRFLISKQKISRLIRDQQLQKNFQFLVIHDCLGHYNNQANKKMPQQKHIKYIKVLLTQRCGRQRFKKICSINHGNKFLKINGQAYHNLYQKGLQYLQYLDNSLKKGKKYETIKKDLEKMTKQSQETLGNSLTQNQSQNPLFSFKNIKQTLNKIEQEDEILKQQIQDILQQIPSDVKQTKNPRRMIKKMMSTPPVQQQKPLRKLGIRKIKTMQQKVAENIILVPPPHYSEV